MQTETEELKHFLRKCGTKWHAIKIVFAHCLEGIQTFLSDWFELFHVLKFFVLLLEVKTPKEYQTHYHKVIQKEKELLARDVEDIGPDEAPF